MNFYTGSGMPSSPIGNVAMAQGPLPYVSVGNGYQTQQPQYPYQGGYYGYYNPWEIQKQQDQYFQQQAAYTNGIIDFEKAIVVNAYRELGIQVDETQFEDYYAQFRPHYNNSADYYKQQQELREQQALQEAVQRSAFQKSTPLDRYVEYFGEREAEMMERYKGKTLEEQYEIMNEIQFDLGMEEAKRANRNLRTGYSGNDYRNLINQSSNNFRNVFGNTNIDDYEVTLPSSIEASYAGKRARFLQKILG